MYLFIGVLHFHKHAQAGSSGKVLFSLLIIQLRPVIPCVVEGEVGLGAARPFISKAHRHVLPTRIPTASPLPPRHISPPLLSPLARPHHSFPNSFPDSISSPFPPPRTDDHGLVRNLLDETFAFRFAQVEVKAPRAGCDPRHQQQPQEHT